MMDEKIARGRALKIRGQYNFATSAFELFVAPDSPTAPAGSFASGLLLAEVPPLGAAPVLGVLQSDAAQQMLDDLWAAGVRPTVLKDARLATLVVNNSVPFETWPGARGAAAANTK